MNHQGKFQPPTRPVETSTSLTTIYQDLSKVLPSPPLQAHHTHQPQVISNFVGPTYHCASSASQCLQPHPHQHNSHRAIASQANHPALSLKYPNRVSRTSTTKTCIATALSSQQDFPQPHPMSLPDPHSHIAPKGHQQCLCNPTMLDDAHDTFSIKEWHDSIPYHPSIYFLHVSPFLFSTTPNIDPPPKPLHDVDFSSRILRDLVCPKDIGHYQR